MRGVAKRTFLEMFRYLGCGIIERYEPCHITFSRSISQFMSVCAWNELGYRFVFVPARIISSLDYGFYGIFRHESGGSSSHVHLIFSENIDESR